MDTATYPLCVTDRDGRILYRHLRRADDGVLDFRGGFGFVDPLDCERFGWIVRDMSARERDNL